MLGGPSDRYNSFTIYGFPQRIRSASTYARAQTLPMYGLMLSKVLPERASTHSPPMSILYSRTSSDFAVSISGDLFSSSDVFGYQPQQSIMSRFYSRS